jgi:hypothetical protein
MQDSLLPFRNILPASPGFNPEDGVSISSEISVLTYNITGIRTKKTIVIIIIIQFVFI